jgi:hypothetical protein
MTTTDPNEFEVPLHCLYRGCIAEGRLRIKAHVSPLRYDTTPLDGWTLFAADLGTLRSLGLCPAHQRLTIDDKSPALEVVARREQHGLLYEIREAGEILGKVTFPSNTLQLQFPPGEVSDKLRVAGARVAALLDFTKRTAGGARAATAR